MIQNAFGHPIIAGVILSGAWYFLFHADFQWTAIFGTQLKNQELLVIGILSAQNNSLQRQAIRSTWGTLLRDKPVKMVFIIGTRTCPVHPADRGTPYTCEGWDPFFPKDGANVSYNVETVPRSVDSTVSQAYVGYTFAVKQNLTVVSLSICSDLLNANNTNARVKLYDSFTGEVIASATFGYDPGISSGLLSKAIRPIRLDSSFEGEIKVNSKFSNSCSVVMSDPSPIRVFEVLDSDGNYADYSTTENSNIVNSGFGFVIEDVDYWSSHDSQRAFRNLLWEEHVSLLGNQLIVEQNEHKDLLLIDVVDVYASLTLKTLAFLRWASTLNYGFVMKTDDDVFLDILTIMDQLTTPNVWDWWSCFKVGWPAPNAGKWRDRLSPSRVYPPFPSGAGYVFRTNSLRKLLTNPYFPKGAVGEDVTLGYLAARFNFKRPTSSICNWSCDSRCAERPCNVPEISVEQMERVWDSYRHCGGICDCHQ